MRIVVTGALGHIGSRLIRELPRAFPMADIRLLDDLSTQRYCSLFNLPSGARYRFCHADVLTADLPKLFEDADAVVHLAAITTAHEGFESAKRTQLVNCAGTEKVARACVRTGSTLVFASTTSVYGDRAGRVDEECPLDELRPQTPYAESKLQAERCILELGNQGGLRFAICRFGTIFGPSPGMQFHTAVNKLCWQAVTGQPLTLWRSALHLQRPYSDLRDAVDAMVFALRKKLFDSGLYNVATLNASIAQVVDAIAAFVPDLAIRYVDSPVQNQHSYQVANNRLVNLGFQFKGDMKQGIAETLRLFAAISANGVGQRGAGLAKSAAPD